MARALRVDAIAEAFDDFATVFRIPADLDDSSVNLALGGLLSQQRDKFPQAYKKWESANTNITALFELINKVRAAVPVASVSAC